MSGFCAVFFHLETRLRAFVAAGTAFGDDSTAAVFFRLATRRFGNADRSVYAVEKRAGHDFGTARQCPRIASSCAAGPGPSERARRCHSIEKRTLYMAIRKHFWSIMKLLKPSNRGGIDDEV